MNADIDPAAARTLDGMNREALEAAVMRLYDALPPAQQDAMYRQACELTARQEARA